MIKEKIIKVCVAGATGWAGSELCKAIVTTNDLELVSGIARKNAGEDLDQLLDLSTGKNIPIFKTVEEALNIPCDVLVEYTSSTRVAKHHIFSAIDKKVNVVVGTSGLTDEDYEEIGQVVESKKGSVLAVGNFAISVVLLNKFAQIAAKYMHYWEIIDYADENKPDAPSGTARELAYRLSHIGQPILKIPINQTEGIKETRGGNLKGTQIHSLRLPGYTLSLEAIFGLQDEKLILRHDAGSSAKPYAEGALLAIRNVHTIVGLKRGLDNVMDL